jgi:hypothetical protein
MDIFRMHLNKKSSIHLIKASSIGMLISLLLKSVLETIPPHKLREQQRTYKMVIIQTSTVKLFDLSNASGLLYVLSLSLSLSHIYILIQRSISLNKMALNYYISF